MSEIYEPHDPNAQVGQAGGLGTSYPDAIQGLVTPQETSYSGATPSPVVDTSAENGQVSPGSSDVQGPPSNVPAAEAPATRDLRGYPADPRFGGLFEGFGQDLGQVQGGIKQASDTFYEEAGPSRTFEGIGGEDILHKGAYEGQSVARPGGNAGYTKAAKDLVGAQYTGPGGFNADLLTGEVQDLQQKGTAGRSQAGTEVLLADRERGDLTPGELRFEAEHLQQDPDYQRQAQEADRAAQEAAGAYNQAQKEASDYAAQRTQEEANIARLAKEYLGGEQAGINTTLDEAVAREQADQDAAAAANARYQETGGMPELQALQPWATEDLGQFDTPTRQLYEEGLAEQERIMGDPKYADISDMPIMTPQMTKGGRQILGFPPDWWEEHKNDHTPAEWGRLKKLALERNKEMAEAGFSPRAENYLTPDIEIVTSGQGKYGDILPMYGGEGIENATEGRTGNQLTPTDSRGYVHFVPGVSPTRENVSTREQRDILNTIAEILGEVERIDPNDEAEVLRHSQVITEVKDFLDHETASTKQAHEATAGWSKEFADLLRQQRKRAIRAHKRLVYGRVGEALGQAVGGLVVPIAGSPVGGLAGKQAGQALA